MCDSLVFIVWFFEKLCEPVTNFQEDQQGRTVKDPWERGQALAEARLTEEREERQRQEEADRREQVRQAELARRSERRRISEEVKLEKERISVTIEATGSGSHEDSKGDNGSDESVRGEDVFQHELYKRAQEAEKERTLVEQEAALYERQFELEYEVALLQEKCRRGTLDRIPTELYSSYGHTEPSGPRQENGQQLPVEDVPWELEQQTWGEKNAELLLMNKWDEAVDYLRADHLRVAEKLEESTGSHYIPRVEQIFDQINPRRISSETVQIHGLGKHESATFDQGNVLLSLRNLM